MNPYPYTPLPKERQEPPSQNAHPAAAGAPTQEPQLVLGLDTGGTFTDAVLFHPQAGCLRKTKTPTTHGAYELCLGHALEQLALSPEERSALSHVALSTTLATNAATEGRVEPAGLLVEAGDLRLPGDFHPHWVALKSSLGFDAREVHPVSEREVLACAERIVAQVSAFAVVSYGGTRNPAHERRIAEILERNFAKPVVQAHTLTHRLNFIERARAAALNAGLLSLILAWLRSMQQVLVRFQLRCPVYIVKSDGALMTCAEALYKPLLTLFSGPAASLRGGSWLATSQAQAEGRTLPASVVVVDIGGTTMDIAQAWRTAGSMRGELRSAGSLIEDRRIALDGIEQSTCGLAGDSRFRCLSPQQWRFDAERCVPFCRTEDLPGFRMEEAQALRDEWRYGDVERLERIVWNPDLAHQDMAAFGKDAQMLLEALRAGPRPQHALRAMLPPVQYAQALEECLRRRRVLRIAFTPTDLLCALGQIPRFSQALAEQALALYAHMLHTTPQALAQRMQATLARQLLAVLLRFYTRAEIGLSGMAQNFEALAGYCIGAQPLLQMNPAQPLVFVGAGAPIFAASLPAALAKQAQQHAHGNVANALGAALSRFDLRAQATITLSANKRLVEVYDHEQRRDFASLNAAFAYAREILELRVRAWGRELGLVEPILQWDERIDTEDSARAPGGLRMPEDPQQSFVIARLEALLSGLPASCAAEPAPSAI